MSGDSLVAMPNGSTGGRRRAHAGRLKRDIAGCFAKHVPRQCRLARLPRSRQDHRRKLRGNAL
jgi:hypothetical protein